MTERRLAYARGQLDRAALADDAPLRFLASSTGLNRYGFSLRNEGWLLDNYQRNPVFLWMHDTSTPPLGRAPAARESGELACYVTFDRGDQFAMSVESKYRRGFLSAVSVSWDFVNHDGTPIEDWWRLSNERMRDDAFYDLSEISAVTVPGDPRALQQQSAHKARALSLLGRQMVELLDEQERGDATAEQIRALVRAELEHLGVDFSALVDDPKKPYGDVEYADPGYQEDGKKRYPLDSEEHCRAAWSYINQEKNAAMYTAEQVAKIKSRIKAAAKRYGIEITEQAHGEGHTPDPPQRPALAGIDRVAADAVLAAFTIREEQQPR